jgi:hypothetical protein
LKRCTSIQICQSKQSIERDHQASAIYVLHDREVIG